MAESVVRSEFSPELKSGSRIVELIPLVDSLNLERVLVEIVPDELAFFRSGVESSLVGLNGVLREFLERNRDISHPIVGGELVPVENIDSDEPIDFGSTDVEEELFVPDGIEVVSDYSMRMGKQ